MSILSNDERFKTLFKFASLITVCDYLRPYPNGTEMEDTFDLVVFGATGFTGRLVAEYLSQNQGISHDLNWAIAGRDINKLDSIKNKMDIPSSIPALRTDINDMDSVRDLVKKTRVLLTTVGPYQIYGNEIIECCIDEGVDYLDLHRHIRQS